MPPRLDQTLFMQLLNQRQRKLDQQRQDEQAAMQALGAANLQMVSQREALAQRELEAKRNAALEKYRIDQTRIAEEKLAAQKLNMEQRQAMEAERLKQGADKLELDAKTKSNKNYHDMVRDATIAKSLGLELPWQLEGPTPENYDTHRQGEAAGYAQYAEILDKQKQQKDAQAHALMLQRQKEAAARALAAQRDEQKRNQGVGLDKVLARTYTKELPVLERQMQDLDEVLGMDVERGATYAGQVQDWVTTRLEKTKGAPLIGDALVPGQEALDKRNEQSDIYRRVQKGINAYRTSVTGAAAAEKELARIEKTIVDPNAGPSEKRQAVLDFKDLLESQVHTRRDYLSQGGAEHAADMTDDASANTGDDIGDMLPGETEQEYEQRLIQELGLE